MQKYLSLQMEKLRKELKKYLKDKFIIDIFIIGSSIKDKPEARDIDLIVLFRESDYKKIEESIYGIKRSIGIEGLHIEPLIVDDMLKESIFSSIIHEGISIRHDKNVSEMIGYKPFVQFTFALENLDKVNKVHFAQALYGRKGQGILREEGGRQIGKGAFIVPVSKEHLFREIMANFKVKYAVMRILANY